MNAESNDIGQQLASQLSRFNDQLDGNVDDVNLVTSIQDGIARLIEASGGNEDGIRRVLQEQYDAGSLRKETFQLVKSVLDRFLTEQIPTEPTAPPGRPQSELDASPVVEDDVYASTTIIEKDSLATSLPEERAQVGSVLRDRFLLQKRIAGGSMGMVYKALDRRLAEAGETDHWVAIKVLSPSLSRNANALRALQQEASKGRHLSHPNIVRFIDFDRDDDLYFIVMEWLDGKTLAELLDTPGTKKLGIDAALEMIRQVGKALEYAHRCGIVHADVKPGNIMLQRDGTAKLFDFGVARIWQKAEAGRAEFDPGILGAMTPAYSSMQVLTGEMPVPADDVFSLACLLYRLIAGYRVFGPRNAAEACEEGMKPQPLPGLSKQQWEAVRKALSYSRVTRFESVAAFLDALNATAIEKIHAEPRGNVHTQDAPDVGKWLVGIAATAIVSGFTAYELGYIDQWLPMTGGEQATSINVGLPADTSAREELQVPAQADTAGAAGLIEDLEPEPDAPAPVEYAVPTPDDGPTADSAGDVELEEAILAQPAPAVPGESVAEDSPLPPADVEIPLDRSGIDRAIVIRLRENDAPVAVDLIRLGSLEAGLRVRLEEVDYTGNRSPLRTKQYTIEGGTTLDFVEGSEKARLNLAMAPDPLREADQRSTLKVRAVDGDFSALAHITIELEDDDQRAFEASLPPDTIGFAVSQMSVGEQDPAAQVDVIRYNPGDAPLTVEYTVSGITASEGDDYFSPGSFLLTFAPGQRSSRLLIPLVQDTRYEGDEAFVVEMINHGTGVPDQVHQRIAIMIRDDDPPPAFEPDGDAS